ncbi:MAG: 1-deoxy-D-xylulose-5-phosphate synthase [Lachnospiraceae bacterium]|nr:1-deoxy-D-xylulose-5-phosphate synthase [Lachnospiraceae bacterium]
MILDKIQTPSDVKKLKQKELEELAGEVRQFLLQSVSKTGGHLASNLGVVELTIALFSVFDLPKDQIIWDVGHQSYTHKLLSGRKEGFQTLRQFGGMSGFPKRKESPCDVFETGHSTTSISAGLGLCQARDLQHQDNFVISVIGDGSLTGGMAYEAMNNAAQLNSNFIIILNDNEMSISPNVGGVSKYLQSIRTAPRYNQLKENVTDTLSKIPKVGSRMVTRIRKTKSGIKQLVIPGMLFENMGLTYLGPIDGHDIGALRDVLEDARQMNSAVLIHIVTQKGRGYRLAEKNPSAFHGVVPFRLNDGKKLVRTKAKSYTELFGETICQMAEKNPKITAITAAMADGTGLKQFSKTYPDRFFDVGIAEQHAVTFAAGLAAGGMKPFVAIYSSFLQRSYDQIIHDVCMQELPVVLLADRAGLVGNDGETHQGVFDISYLAHIPNLTVMAPKNGKELVAMLHFAETFDQPLAIRYPRGAAVTAMEQYDAPIQWGKGEVLEAERGIALLAFGSMVQTAMEVHESLKQKQIASTVVNLRFASPIDRKLVAQLTEEHNIIVTLEENVLRGGVGEAISAYLLEIGYTGSILPIGIPDAFVEHGSVSQLKEMLEIDSTGIEQQILELYSR